MEEGGCLSSDGLAGRRGGCGCRLGSLDWSCRRLQRPPNQDMEVESIKMAACEAAADG